MIQYDFHFHLLFKHAISNLKDKVDQPIQIENVIAKLLNEIFGGPFASQCSPSMVKDSKLYFGVIGILALEHAFVNHMFSIPLFSLQKNLPLDQEMIQKIKTGGTDYHQLFREQLDFTLNSIDKFSDWKIAILKRSSAEVKEQSMKDIQDALSNTDDKKYVGSRWFALSIEGGHNLSDVPIHGVQHCQTPDLTLKALQNDPRYDFISMNLCHLSFIPELQLGGFAQGLNKTAQIAFKSEEFYPSEGKGLTPLGKKVIRQALTHQEKPILIDVKHMSVYTRFQYYRFKEKLEKESPDVSRLPIISSHTGFTFTQISEYLKKREYTSEATVNSLGKKEVKVSSNERKIGKSDDWINSGLHCNPWSIGLFDEEILEIMKSKGMIGISLDQRVLGTEKMFADSRRGTYYEGEYIATDEFEQLFEKEQMPEAESLVGRILQKLLPPSSKERHSMLLALHVVQAVRVALNSNLWTLSEDVNAPSPYDHICIGSDFDGLINPINSIQNVSSIDLLKGELIKYLPVADRTLPFYENYKALLYNDKGELIASHMEKMIDKILILNGLKFLSRFMNNWK